MDYSRIDGLSLSDALELEKLPKHIQDCIETTLNRLEDEYVAKCNSTTEEIRLRDERISELNRHLVYAEQELCGAEKR